MKTILVTGGKGFIGRNLIEALSRRSGVTIRISDIDTPHNELERFLREADIIYHLAGVNRPSCPEEYEAGNVGATKDLLASLEAIGRLPVIVFSSSTQAILDNPYGLSKREAEKVLEQWAARTSAPVVFFRLPNVFGRWARPHYNSAIATFCYNIARGMDIDISDRKHELELVHVDDVVNSFIALMDSSLGTGARYHHIAPSFKITLGEIVDLLYLFKSSRKSMEIPNMADPLIKRLYGTYLTYMLEGDFSYSLERKIDQRGALAELLKSPSFGQVFVSRTKPGETRGNHYHNLKTEKFCVLEGNAVIRFREIQGTKVFSYPVRGTDFSVFDISPGYTHSIENVGDTEMVVLFWANEIFDPKKPDTFPLEVNNEKT